MSDTKRLIRLETREIAVLFSLFIFVSLLMLTVGILVGKGLTQAKYEAKFSHEKSEGTESPETAGALTTSPPTSQANLDLSGAAVIHADGGAAGKHAETTTPSSAANITSTPPTLTAPADGGHALEEKKPAAGPEKLKTKLTPLSPLDKSPGGFVSRDPHFAPSAKETEDLLKSPSIRNLVDVPPDSKRSNASIPSGKVPELGGGQASGPYTVQVGYYLAEKEAKERVEQLKKLGYSHAYFSAKEWSESKETWYRVWLGYFADHESARQGGEALLRRDEVRNYLVRKSEASN